MRIIETDKVEIEEGDLVCLRTGFDRVILGMGKDPDRKRSRPIPAPRSTGATSGC